MDKFPKEMLIEIALKLDIENIIKFCKTNKRTNFVVCENEHFWRRKLLKDYPNFKELTEVHTSYKSTYLRIFSFYESIHNACLSILDHFFGESQGYMNKEQYIKDFKNAVIEFHVNKEKLDDYEFLDFKYDFRIKYKHLFPGILQNIHSQRVRDIIYDSPDDPLVMLEEEVNFDIFK